MIKIKTTAEIVEMSELYEVCEKAGLGRELEASEQTLTDLLFDEIWNRNVRTELEYSY